MGIKTYSRSKNQSFRANRSRNNRSFLRDTRKRNLKKNTSCRYFALKEYFTSLGFNNANSERKIIKFTMSEYDNDSTLLEDGVEFPEGKSVIFITQKGDKISDTIHAFVLDNTPDGFYIHSSWGLFSCSTMSQWKRYRRELSRINSPYLKIGRAHV
jgi:hypothetical protein